MRKVRTIVNLALGAMITALGLSSCEGAKKYGPDPNFEVLYGPAPIEEDSTVQCKYGVNPDLINEINE
jgi:hypothetical protein